MIVRNANIFLTENDKMNIVNVELKK